MQCGCYSEFIGLSPRLATLIESHRLDPDETKDAILTRLLGEHPPTASILNSSQKDNEPDLLDLGQGVRVKVGESIFLFLSEESKKANEPDGVGTVQKNGISIDGTVVPKSRGSYIHPAMVKIQKIKGHKNAKGEIISLSAWRQWYVDRDGLVPLIKLKDPHLARKRDRAVLTLEDLGL
jgi:hypothetical protein